MNRMKIISAVILFLLVLSCDQTTHENPSETKTETANTAGAESEEDKQAIEQIYANWYTAWEKKDYKLAARDYSDDAVWVNAFGMRRVGRAEIEKTLEKVFGMESVMAGKSKTVEKTIRFIKPDVALVSSLVERGGQEMPSGEKLGTRRTSHLRVFVKSGGQWQIVNHLISDARERERAEIRPLVYPGARQTSGDLKIRLENERRIL